MPLQRSESSIGTPNPLPTSARVTTFGHCLSCLLSIAVTWSLLHIASSIPDPQDSLHPLALPGRDEGHENLCTVRRPEGCSLGGTASSSPENVDPWVYDDGWAQWRWATKNSVQCCLSSHVPTALQALVRDQMPQLSFSGDRGQRQACRNISQGCHSHGREDATVCDKHRYPHN